MEKEKTLYTLRIFSENIAGILNSVTSVFSRRMMNIESLNVSASSIEGLHRYTITCYSDEETIKNVNAQIEKKIGVVRSEYYTENEIYIQDVTLLKLSTPKVLEYKEITKIVRKFSANIVEVNPTFTIVVKHGTTDEILQMYERLKKYDCVLQYVSSGPIAITLGKRELLTEYLEELKKKERNL
ncbi:MAG: acetolactate synthase small subunit [Prevotellaceae bacterium]|nr:acetolactate synthase small subunit [Candidatus Faecinaster equi]